MPNIKSAIKRMRSDARKRERNQATLSELKTLEKNMRKNASDNPSKAKEIGQRLISRFDRAVTRGIVPRGRADRKKSRVTVFLAKLPSKSKS